jgi:hypothetical protein
MIGAIDTPYCEDPITTWALLLQFALAIETDFPGVEFSIGVLTTAHAPGDSGLPTVRDPAKRT